MAEEIIPIKLFDPGYLFEKKYKFYFKRQNKQANLVS